jgi:hypothetical protein
MAAAAVIAVAAAAVVAVVGVASAAVVAVVVVVVVVVAVVVAGVAFLETALSASAAGAVFASFVVAVAGAAVVGSLAFTFAGTFSPVRESSASVSPGKRVALKEKWCPALTCCAGAGLLASTIKPSSISKLMLRCFDHVPLLLCPFIW